MRKIIALIGMCALFFLLGCQHVRCEETTEAPIKIVASTFPVWLFTANIIAGVPGVELELLIPAAAGCPHDFSLKPADLKKLHSAKILVINGAGLEEFLAKPLANLETRPDIIDASSQIPVLDSGEEQHMHVNSHTFAAPGEACLMVRNIAAGLAGLDASHADVYASNASRYMETLNALSNRLEGIGQKAKNRSIVLEHEGLAYLAANAGLRIIATIEPPLSPAQLSEIGRTISREKPALLIGELQYPDKLLKALSAETGVPQIRLDSCSSGPANAPLDYYQVEMAKNLDLLEKHLD